MMVRDVVEDPMAQKGRLTCEGCLAWMERLADKAEGKAKK